MSLDAWESPVREALNALHKVDSHRQRCQVVPIDATHVLVNGKRSVNFASNDYLGLTHHPRVMEAARRALAEYGSGAGASPLICGYTPAHAAAERRIAQWKGAQASVLLPSGYQANLAAIHTLAIGAQRGGRSIRFLLDKLCHASLVDAVRATGQEFRVYPHQRIEKLERLLAQSEPDQIQAVVTESIFSMDGDAADLRALAALRRKYGCLLLVDEAHAGGVYGPEGGGLAAELGLSGEVDVTIATLSKAIGCVGGAVCGSGIFCEAVVNFARAYIYSTSLPAHVAAAAKTAIEVMRDEPQRIRRLRALAGAVRRALSLTRFTVPKGDSPVIPLVMGSEPEALEAAEFLAGRGLLAWPIRPPTVPRGTSRLRITLSSEHDDGEIEALLAGVRDLSERPVRSGDRPL
jgi:8-amino-7-oxononanoate synthase